MQTYQFSNGRYRVWILVRSKYCPVTLFLTWFRNERALGISATRDGYTVFSFIV